MARARKLPFPTQIPKGLILQTRKRQGRKARAIDDKEAHVIQAPFVATTERERDIHKLWATDPGEADILGIDAPEAIKVDPKREAERKKAGEIDPPIPPARPRVKPAKKKATAPTEPKAGPKAKDPFRRYPDLKTKPGKLGKDGLFDGYIITGGNASQRAVIHAAIQDNYSKEELKDTRGLVIDIGSKLRGNLAGVYLDRHGGFRTNRAVTKKMMNVPGARHYMRIDKDYLQGDVITHEMAHHMRAQRLRKGDTGDKDLTKRQAEQLFFDHDREEATTDLETLARHNKYESSSPYAKDAKGNRRIERPSPAGYYYRVSRGSGMDTRQVENQDRAIVTLPGSLEARKKAAGGNYKKKNGFTDYRDPDERLRTSGLQGKRLRKAINKNFDDTNMGNSKMGRSARKISGKIENLDQYFAAVDDDGNVVARAHIRSPKLKNKDRAGAELLKSTAPAGSKIVKYNDGKPTTLGRVPTGGRKRLVL
jgi:hypothetical protein